MPRPQIRRQMPYNPERVETERRDFYVYEAETLDIQAQTNANDTVQIESDSDFILQKLTYEADLAAAAQTDGTRVIPLVTVLLTDTGSGRQLMNNPIPIPSFFGTGELPFILPNPRLLARNSVLNVAFTNFSAATAYDIRLAFIGYKVYKLT